VFCIIVGQHTAVYVEGSLVARTDLEARERDASKTSLMTQDAVGIAYSTDLRA
jgi:hypothetical protein